MSQAGPAPGARMSARALGRGVCLLAIAIACSVASAQDKAAPTDAAWQHGLAWRGQTVAMQAQGQDFTLTGATAPRAIPAQALRSQTASPLFDGLFALAQPNCSRPRSSRSPTAPSTRGSRSPARASRPARSGATCGPATFRTRPTSRWRGCRPNARAHRLRFKLSGVRAPAAAGGFFVAQDTGSGGSWPISSDRVVWFLAARHLVDDADDDSRRFADETWRALTTRCARTAPSSSTSASASIAVRPPSSTGANSPTRAGPQTMSVSSRSPSRCRPMSCSTRRCGSASRWPSAAATPARRPTHARPTRCAKAIDRPFWSEERGLYMSYIGPPSIRCPSRPTTCSAWRWRSRRRRPARTRAPRAARYPVAGQRQSGDLAAAAGHGDLPQPRDLAVRQRLFAARRAHDRARRASPTKSAR